MTSKNINPFFFWQSSSPFSNWHPAKFKDDNGRTFYNSEQYMMYKKANFISRYRSSKVNIRI